MMCVPNGQTEERENKKKVICPLKFFEVRAWKTLRGSHKVRTKLNSISFVIFRYGKFYDKQMRFLANFLTINFIRVLALKLKFKSDFDKWFFFQYLSWPYTIILFTHCTVNFSNIVIFVLRGDPKIEILQLLHGCLTQATLYKVICTIFWC